MMPESAISAVERYAMLSHGDRVVVGLSGGADSVCLLSLLCSLREKYSLTLTAAHVNHGIRGDEAKRDEDFCIKLCEKLGVQCEVLHADIPALAKQSGEGLEECGRRVRYEFFNSLCGENGKIAVAHNMNDVAETLIFNLTRGTALKGAGSILPVRDNVIRPLIDTPRSEIEAYLKENGLTYVTDSTNLENDYARNKIRNLVLPVLTEINPDAVGAMAAFCEGVRNDAAFLDSLADGAFADCVKDSELDEKKFSRLNASVKGRVAKKYLESLTDADVLSKHVEDFLKFSQNGEALQTAGALRLVKRNGIIKPFEDCAAAFSVEFKKENCSVSYPYGEAHISIIGKKDLQNLNKALAENLIDCDKIADSLKLRSRSEGDAITLKKRGVTKTLKKLFNEAGIEPSKRNTVAILDSGGCAVWVEGFGVNKKFSADGNSEKMLLITLGEGR